MATPFSWGRVGVWPRLPRVRYGRTVIAPARWIVPNRLRPGNAAPEEWDSELTRWRAEQNVPARVRVGAYDRYLDLNLCDRLQRVIFRQELARSETNLVVHEAPSSTPDAAGWSGGRITELVVPLASKHPAAAGVPIRTRPAMEDRTVHLPGSEWLSVRVYSDPDTHDRFLRDEVPKLLESLPPAVDRWFFLRYADEAGPHLRLRLHTGEQDGSASLLPLVRKWISPLISSGRARDIYVDSYRPETVRYGSGETLQAVERLFHRDSETVLEQLRQPCAGSDSYHLAANYADLLGAFGSWDWTAWVAHIIPERTRIAADDRARARTLLAERAGAVCVGDDSVAPWIRSAHAERRRIEAERYGAAIGVTSEWDDVVAARIASVLHMHANRRSGTDPAREDAAWGILRHAVRALTGRRRARWE